MAKLSIEESKLKLEPIEKAIQFFKDSGIPVLPLVQAEYDRLVKIITGKSSSNTAKWFNDNIATQLNGNQDVVSAIESNCGVKSRMTVTVVTNEDGSKKVVFEGANVGSSGGQKAGTTSGGSKSSTPYNHFVVSVLPANPNANDYKEATGTFGTASKAVEFILNGGKNPMNLGAEWQSGNSMVRATDSLLKIEHFTEWFTLDRSSVVKEKPAAEPNQTTETPTA